MPVLEAMSRAQESRRAIERLYTAMRHLFNRGFYKPMGNSGKSIRQALLTVSPEIYGSINNPEKVELDGLLYVIDRLPRGIESCRVVRLVSDEGYRNSQYPVIIPAKRRRNCYRIDSENMLIEVTRGRSEIYDILTHLTFLYIESLKIKNHAVDENGNYRGEWKKIEEMVLARQKAEQAGEQASHEQEATEGSVLDEETAVSYLSFLLGRTFAETRTAYERFKQSTGSYGFFDVVYWLGKKAIDEINQKDLEREIRFSESLRDRIGNHQFGYIWADDIKDYLRQNNLLQRPIHIISANTHSIMNSLFAYAALEEGSKQHQLNDLAVFLSTASDDERKKVVAYAEAHGMHTITDRSGTNITVQVFDTTKIDVSCLPAEIEADQAFIHENKPVIIVMDYAFGEQAYETMDELLKPYELEDKAINMNVVSVSVMGKAGILSGGKGDVMIPTAHLFEGTADNYPFDNQLKASQFEGYGIEVYEGPMVTVLGTSLQNKDILEYFHSSTWNAIGLEMEGAHYQKAIQAHATIRKSISSKVTLRYAYYASDNPLITGSTLASGGLGEQGVKPTYLISRSILNHILGGK